MAVEACSPYFSKQSCRYWMKPSKPLHFVDFSSSLNLVRELEATVTYQPGARFKQHTGRSGRLSWGEPAGPARAGCGVAPGQALLGAYNSMLCGPSSKLSNNPQNQCEMFHGRGLN